MVLNPKPSDRVLVFPTMHDASVLMQTEFPLARDIDRNGELWTTTLIRSSLDQSRTLFPQPVTLRIRALGWITLIEVIFVDHSTWRFMHSRDGFEDYKAVLRAKRHVLSLVPDLTVLSSLDILRERKRKAAMGS